MLPWFLLLILPDPLCSQYFEFACKNGRQCLPKEMVCDGIRQCDDGSDEDPNHAYCSMFSSVFSIILKPYTAKSVDHDLLIEFMFSHVVKLDDHFGGENCSPLYSVWPFYI